MFESFNKILVAIDDFVWGVPLIVMIIAVGILLTVRLRGLQFHKLGLAFKYMFKNEKDGKDGEVSSFAALCTSLSATIGTGNIVGVATAVVAGGAGALFWMWVAAIVGIATKYAECMLAVKYRTVAEDGHIVGGPFYYIEKGMGSKWKWLAKLFAIFGVLAGLLGIGTFTQINGITSAVNNFFDPENAWSVTVFGMDYSWTVVIAGILLTICTALVIIGGLQRISSVSQIVVPFMAILYIIAGLVIIFTHITEIPVAFVEIVQSAFGLRAVSGGALGAMLIAMQKGVARGIFSNEAGLGSAPIAACTATVDDPVKQGLVSMLGTFIDTIIVCTMTGLAIVLTGSHTYAVENGIDGVAVTSRAFEMGLPFPEQVSAFILMVCLVFFAFTTILGWDYYSEKCLEYLCKGNQKVVKGYRWLYILAVFIGPFMTVSAVWTIADIFNGLMAIPNLIALVALSGVCAVQTNKYFKEGKHKQ